MIDPFNPHPFDALIWLMHLFISLICLAFVLWFCFTVTDKLTRMVYLMRELLRTADPRHPEFVPPKLPKPIDSSYYSAAKINAVMSSRKLSKNQ